MFQTTLFNEQINNGTVIDWPCDRAGHRWLDNAPIHIEVALYRQWCNTTESSPMSSAIRYQCSQVIREQKNSRVRGLQSASPSPVINGDNWTPDFYATFDPHGWEPWDTGLKSNPLSYILIFCTAGIVLWNIFEREIQLSKPLLKLYNYVSNASVSKWNACIGNNGFPRKSLLPFPRCSPAINA